MTIKYQLALFGLAPYRPTETSLAGAQHIAPKARSLEDRVLLALYHTPGLTDAGLDRVLGTVEGRSARPRRNTLMRIGYVEEVGKCKGESGVLNACWGLTAAGEAAARKLL